MPKPRRLAKKRKTFKNKLSEIRPKFREQFHEYMRRPVWPEEEKLF